MLVTLRVVPDAQAVEYSDLLICAVPEHFESVPYEWLKRTIEFAVVPDPP